MSSKRLAILAVGATLAACSSTNDDVRARVESTSPLSLAFAHAAERSGVPRDLLVAIARVEDGLELPAQRLDLDEDNEVPAAGPLMLRRGKLDTLARGAALASATELELRRDADLALDAGALVLAELGRETHARPGDLASWKSAVEAMSGYADDDHREEYAHRVFATLARGGRFAGRDGETVVLAPHDLPPTLTLDLSFKLHTLAMAQYPGAQWIPTSCAGKCNVGRSGAKVEYIVIHDTEGGWDASVATLQNDPGKSVQYIVGVDGKIGQFVDENTTAWHAGNSHYNQRSIGIEHVGYSTKPFAEAEYAASAKLVAHLTTKYGVPRDRAHIIGHDQIPNGNRIARASAPCADSPKKCQSSLSYGGASGHTDPGIWEWPTYMDRFAGASKCNDVTALWSCSHDKKKAFRCAASGKVEVATCDAPEACEAKAAGTDDVCHMSPKPQATPPAGPTDPPAAPRPPPETTGATLPSTDEPAAGNEDDEEAGCAVSSRRSRAPAGAVVGLLLAAAAIARRRARRA
ncbi:MAG: N-acetylmuramoyl-L-alanine amidase [Labilithrix sp.]|nr:N-acetylmuramoyl-L-alanine amidase [Labilithrix sp.]